MDFKAQKDPAEAKIYVFDFALHLTDLANAEITDAQVRVVTDPGSPSNPTPDPTSDLTVEAVETVGLQVRFLASGGVRDEDYLVECQITLMDGTSRNRQSKLQVRNL